MIAGVCTEDFFLSYFFHVIVSVESDVITISYVRWYYWNSIVFLLSLCQVDLRRAYNCEIMLSKIKIPLPDMIVSFFLLLMLHVRLAPMQFDFLEKRFWFLAPIGFFLHGSLRKCGIRLPLNIVCAGFWKFSVWKQCLTLMSIDERDLIYFLYKKTDLLICVIIFFTIDVFFLWYLFLYDAASKYCLIMYFFIGNRKILLIDKTIGSPSSTQGAYMEYT